MLQRANNIQKSQLANLNLGRVSNILQHEIERFLIVTIYKCIPSGSAECLNASQPIIHYSMMLYNQQYWHVTSRMILVVYV